MGACFSSCSKNKASSPEKKNKKKQTTTAAIGCRDPPPAPDSPPEETVKEVLSETPKLRAKSREEAQDQEREASDVTMNGCGDERSEDASEAYSASEGFSASTTTVKEKKAGGDEVEEADGRRRRAERSPAKPQTQGQGRRPVPGPGPGPGPGEISVKRVDDRDRGVGVGCRSGRSSPSAAKRAEGAVGRTNSGEKAGQGTIRSRAPSGSHGIRRQPAGERSGRRSASPGAKRASDQRLGGQCRGLPSTTKESGRASPRRLPTPPTPPPPPPAARADSDGERVAYGGDSAEGKESLENPLVSMECFIFL